jgi:prepilin-type N-terminal cleavage/methylation domain-containing protein
LFERGWKKKAKLLFDKFEEIIIKGGSMKKGFTLLELIIVIIILGVLATLGFTQYGRMIERARGAEARGICGDIRKFAAAFRLEHGDINTMVDNDVNIGPDTDQIPGACRGTHYFSYAIGVADPTVTITATRCDASGKTPGGGPAIGRTLILTSTLDTGVDVWGGDGGY